MDVWKASPQIQRYRPRGTGGRRRGGLIEFLFEDIGRETARKSGAYVVVGKDGTLITADCIEEKNSASGLCQGYLDRMRATRK